MKKRLFFFAAAALALAACSNDEVVEVNQGDAISFRPVVSNVTRAANEHFNAANDQFGVTAFHQGETSSPYFDNVTFKGSGGPITFTSQSNKYYWPSSVNLDFYAYAPLSTEVGGSGSAAVARSDYNSFTVTPGTDVPNQPDFVYAVTKDWGKASLQTGTATTHKIENSVTGVTINFRHAESKVAIKLANTNDNLKITVGEVTIGNLRGSETFTWNGVTDGTTETAAASANTDGRYTSGTLTYLNGTWTASSAQTSAYTVTMESDASYNVLNGTTAAKELYSDDNNAPNYDKILIPQALAVATAYANSGSANVGDAFAGAYITVQIKIQNKATSDYIIGDGSTFVTAMWPLTALTWLPGHKYTYTIDLAGGGYFTTNQDTNEDLDPILEGAEIKFVTVKVDEWADGGATGVYTTGL